MGNDWNAEQGHGEQALRRMAKEDKRNDALLRLYRTLLEEALECGFPDDPDGLDVEDISVMREVRRKIEAALKDPK